MASENAGEASSISVPTTRSSVTAGVVLGSASLTMGLIAGVFYAYAVSAMPGLDRADDRTLVDGMQQINEAIENPVFFLSFLGAPALTAAAAIMHWRAGAGQVTRWIIAALVLYGVAFLVTVAFNISGSEATIVFAAILDAGRGGRYRLGPAVAGWTTKRLYQTATCRGLGCRPPPLLRLCLGARI